MSRDLLKWGGAMLAGIMIMGSLTLYNSLFIDKHKRDKIESKLSTRAVYVGGNSNTSYMFNRDLNQDRTLESVLYMRIDGKEHFREIVREGHNIELRKIKIERYNP